jgi:hypothetical protein
MREATNDLAQKEWLKEWRFARLGGSDKDIAAPSDCATLAPIKPTLSVVE